jgi:outer membrane lipoprotein SlyB
MSGMKRTSTSVAVAVAVLASTALAGCTPTGRYHDEIFTSTTKTTVIYGSAPDLRTGAPVNPRTHQAEVEPLWEAVLVTHLDL